MGRYLRETNAAPGEDDCWYPGSPRPPFTEVTQLEPFPIDNEDNKYGDIVGWGDLSIEHYRSMLRAPCENRTPQRMSISCGVAPTWSAFKDNLLRNTIGVTTVTRGVAA